MKKIIRLLFVLTILSFSQLSFGQLYLDGEGNAGVGVQTSTHSRMTILNETEGTTLKIINGSNSSSMYGIDILVDSIGSGSKLGIVSKVNQKPGGSGEVAAFKAFVHPNGGGNTIAYGVYNEIEQNGSGGTRGISTDITQSGSGQLEGEYNTITQHGSGQTYSSRNSITQNGGGRTVGVDMNITQNGSGDTFSSNNRVTQNGDGTTVGVNMDITQNGLGQTFGMRNYIAANNDNNTNTLYGFHSTMTGTSTTTPMVGIYSHAVGANSKAASFIGDVYINGVMLQASDARIKENVENIPNAIEIIEVTQPKQYNFKNLRHHGNDPNTQQFGFLAQDLERVLPNLVKTVVHPGRIIQVESANGRGSQFQRLEEDEEVKTVNYIALIPILTQAIKEQQILIKELTERVAELEE